jgi:hypothetical protein
MTLQCSLQLFNYLRKRRAHMPTEQAAAEAGIGLAEARLHDADEAKGLLKHVDTTEMPHLDFKQPTAPAAGKAPLRESVNAGRDEAGHRPAKEAAGAQPQEDNMARAKRKAADEVVEIQKPDFDMARRIYLHDIKPAQGKVGEHAQEMSTAYKEVKKAAHIQPQAAKLAFKLVEMEESKRDDYLRSLRGLLTVFRIFIPKDLVDQAEGKGDDDSNVIQFGEAQRPSLATIPSDDSDLAGGDDDATWRAGLKEGDKVIVPADGPETADTEGVVTFMEGDEIDVDVDMGNGPETITLPRADVLRPSAAADETEHAQAAE